ncbi:ABC transporter ATP-binding protein [Butyrivibrio sp. WCD3002]|uniref:ABC transporter ATP-binding protein n=1 Tax=Butyrivibrio sp. WCD3002 TaxID=1280676 RepID=UPI0003FD0407|nr:ABC transporter ATP-binding protein [Butyrivibrio sp. WCD3002]
MKKLMHFIKLAWSISPMYIIALVLKALLGGANMLLNVILPKLLIDEIMGDKQVNMLILFGVLIVLNNVLMKLFENILDRYLNIRGEFVNKTMQEKMGEKIMNIEYSYLEDPYYLDLKERAVFAISNQDAISRLISYVSQTLTSIVTLIGLLAVLLTLGPVLIILMAVAAGLSMMAYALSMKKVTGLMQQLIPINRRYNYYFSLGMEEKAQKEIRLYDLEPMITETVLNENKSVCDLYGKAMRGLAVSTGLMQVITIGATALTYLYVGVRTLSDRFGTMLSIGSLTMYVSSAVSFSRAMQSCGEQVVMLIQTLSYLSPYLEFMEIEEEVLETGKEKFEGPINTLEFRNVTFTYPKAEKPTLKNVSFIVKRGEKISIVGLNGAGKSTLVKLICRMYKLDSGEILVNGKNIYEYDYRTYMSSISAVFQDFKLFNFTIAENVSCKESNTENEKAKVLRLMEEVGMKEKVDELKNGIESRFGKEYDEDGIEMSGGQGQKIAIARALYKPSEMVILDEPASALDPIAEAEIYEKFNSLVEDKTAIYISHRMSSSKFCDKILIIDGGTVTDYDTHNNLMQKTDSLYYQLFMAQAENYKLA